MPSLSSFCAVLKPWRGEGKAAARRVVLVSSKFGVHRVAASCYWRCCVGTLAEGRHALQAASQRQRPVAGHVARRCAPTGMPFSTMKAVMPWDPASVSVLAYTIRVPAWWQALLGWCAG